MVMIIYNIDRDVYIVVIVWFLYKLIYVIWFSICNIYYFKLIVFRKGYGLVVGCDILVSIICLKYN